MNTYNHIFSLGFSVSGSVHPKGEDVTPAQFRAGVDKRLKQLGLDEKEWSEAVGPAEDSYVETKPLLDFTVIGFREDTGSIFCEHVEALNEASAFYVAAKDNEHITFVAVVPGHQSEGVGISFPGSGVVDAFVVLEQPEVFNI